MPLPLELGIGLRYLRARRRTRFASFITVASLFGIAVGVTALIVILSVMNGFENELRERLLGMTAHARLRAPAGEMIDDWRALRQRVLAVDEVTAAAPVTPIEGMIRAEGALHPVLIEGVDPSLESTVSRVTQNLVYGSLSSLVAGEQQILLGRILALKLGVVPGDTVRVLVPVTGGRQLSAELASFRFAGMFEAGVQDHDAALALIHRDDAATLAGHSGGVAEIRFRVDDVFAAARVADGIVGDLDGGYEALAWSEEHASFFRAVLLEKRMMSLIMSLIIAVAAFNIVASLVMVVTDKRTDIAILRTLGLPVRSVVRVFLFQGLVIGWFGALLGIALGVALALNVPTLVPFLEQTFGFQIMPGDVYVMTEIPSDLRSGDVARVGVMALALTAAATLYPARRAAAIEPAMAMRYE
ncbi:MAG: lipoprotein-releasing ABC transporter permease subunit [Pseudomonadota bacterium]